MKDIKELIIVMYDKEGRGNFIMSKSLDTDFV